MKRGVMVASISCGIFCVACVLMYASFVRGEADAAHREAMERYGGEQVEVLVATKDIYPGEIVTSANSESRTWLSDLLPEGSVTSLDQIQGRQTTSFVVSGEVLCFKRFEGEKSTLDIPEGCVALSVPAKDVQAVGGSLSPGNIVDVYAVGASTTRIGSSVLVLATNADTTDSKKTSVSWVTLAVPLDQSQEFVTASQSMDIYFTLPAKTDKDATASSAISADTKGDGDE